MHGGETIACQLRHARLKERRIGLRCSPHEATARRPEGEEEGGCSQLRRRVTRPLPAAEEEGRATTAHQPASAARHPGPVLAGRHSMEEEASRCPSCQPAARPPSYSAAAARMERRTIEHCSSRRWSASLLSDGELLGDEERCSPPSVRGFSAARRGGAPLLAMHGCSPISMLHATTLCFDEGPPCPLLDDGCPPEEKAAQPLLVAWEGESPLAAHACCSTMHEGETAACQLGHARLKERRIGLRCLPHEATARRPEGEEEDGCSRIRRRVTRPLPAAEEEGRATTARQHASAARHPGPVLAGRHSMEEEASRRMPLMPHHHARSHGEEDDRALFITKVVRFTAR
ncbi:hypothetical protein Dimus_013727 [Dionaea muscipula]